MLNTSQFFSSLVSQYVGKYNSIALRFGGSSSPGASSATASSPTISTPAATSTNEASTQPTLAAPRRDSVLLAQAPTLEAPSTDLARAKQDGFEAQKLPVQTAGSLPEAPDSAEGESDPATYSSSFSSLRYGLKMKFDMQAIQRTVYQLSSTQTADRTTIDESFESLFAGGFGFSADMKLSGISVKATATDSGHATDSYRKNESIQQGREMQHEAEETKKSLSAESRQSYQVAVNRVSLRYKTDTQFSFSNFTRFQSQVEQLNGERPESVGTYSDQVGALAQNAPNEVVGQFFDTVDGYLQTKEDSLIENAERFFDIAAESLGLSAEAVEAAKASVTNRIESFFDSVESNLNGLESSFKQPSLNQPTPGENSGAITQNPVALDGSNLSELAQKSKEDGHSLLADLIAGARDDDDDDHEAKATSKSEHSHEVKDSKKDKDGEERHTHSSKS
jgi:hypothetical protein